MKPEDLIQKGMLRDTDLEGGPPAMEEPKLGAFGRYILLEEVGRGGAANVYRALDPLLNREVALKRLRFGDPEMEARFLREAELLAKLSHSGVMPVFDFGREGDSHYYTMPLAPGLSLDRWLAVARPPAREAAQIIKLAAEALAHAHDRGILHRDIKSANILISQEGNPVLGDFGLGRIESAEAADEARVTKSGEIMGTPGYMAPELAWGDLKKVDARTDVYGLGATLYEAMTGQPPFVGNTSMEVLQRVIREEPKRPRKFAPKVPADLEVICLKALEKEPDRRYASARDLADDLGRFLAGEPIRARRSSPVYRLRRFVSRHRAVTAVSVAGLAVAAGIGLFALFLAVDTGARRRRVTDHLELAARHAAAINDLLHTQPESDPDVERQAKLAFEEIDKAMAIEPGNADAHFLRGRVHSLRFEKDEARRSYELAIQKGPVARAYLERALLDCQDLVVLRAAGTGASSARTEELRAGVHRDLTDFMALMSDPPELEFAKALLEFSKLDAAGFTAAVLSLDAYAQHARDWRAYFWKGFAELELDQFGPARDSLKMARDSRPRCRASALILDRLGLAYFNLDQPEEAERQFRQASELDPNLPHPKTNLASVFLEQENFEEAIRWSEEALTLSPTSANAHAIRGQAYVMKHMKVKMGADQGRKLLRAAKESLEAALSAYPAESDQGRDLKIDLDYVLRFLNY